MRTPAGVKPGDAVADLIFALVFHAVQEAIYRQLRARGLLQTVLLDPAGPFAPDDLQAQLVVEIPPPTFHGDIVVPLAAASPEALLDAVAEVGAILVEATAAFGLRINLDEGKTEAVYSLLGRGTQAARRRLVQSMVPTAAGKQVPALPLRCGGSLRLVQTYKHLGVQVAGSGASRPETAQRCRSAQVASIALGRSVFAKRQLSKEVRLHVARASVESRLLHHAGAWCELSQTEWGRVEAALLAPGRRVAGVQRLAATSDEHVTNEQVREQLHLPTARALVDIQRLRLAARVHRLAPHALRGLLQSEGAAAWRKEVCVALAIMQAMLAPKLDVCPSPTTAAALQQWMDLAVSCPRQWAGYLRSWRAACGQDPAAHGRLSAGCRDRAGPDSEEDGEFLCAACGTEWPTRRALRLHQLHAHGRRREARCWVGSPACPGCGRWWHTRLRAMHHFERSGGCRAAVAASGIGPLGDEAVSALDEADRVERRRCRGLGVSELAGPRPYWRRRSRAKRPQQGVQIGRAPLQRSGRSADRQQVGFPNAV